MRRVIYCSQATFDFSPEELVDLLRDARERNSDVGISGMLLHCSASFLQMLEGEEEAIADTLGRIQSDDRHDGVRLLLDSTVDSRLFPDWSMGFESLDDDELSDTIEGYVPEGEHPLVNPDLVTNGDVAQRLLVLYGDNRLPR